MKMMLPQISSRRDNRRRSGKKPAGGGNQTLKIKNFVGLPIFFCLGAAAIFFLGACRSSPPLDLRRAAPVDALVYLETNDLGRTLEALTENDTFRQLARNAADFSAVRDIRMAVVVTGFEASEKQLSEESSILNFKPRFVAVADTRFWESQTKQFTEEMLGNFINRIYGGEIDLEVSARHDGVWYEWTAVDGRTAFAYVEGGQIFFGNDETAIEKSLTVKRGESENLTGNENFMRQYRQKTADDMAFGYIAPEGIAQIANIIGVSAAIEATEDDDGRSFIAGVLPEILRNTTRQITWTARKIDRGIEDKIFITPKEKIAPVLTETMDPAAAADKAALAAYLPPEPLSATFYNLEDPAVAWRSLVSLMSDNTGNRSGAVIEQFSGELLEPYGVSRAEDFLSQVDSVLLTARFDRDGERSIAVVRVKDAEKIKPAITPEINFRRPPEKKDDADIWYSEDELLAAAFVGNILILGDAETAADCLEAKKNGRNFTTGPAFELLRQSRTASAATYGEDLETGEKIVGLLGIPKENIREITPFFITETIFTGQGVVRKTVSDFGLPGTILEQLEE